MVHADETPTGRRQRFSKVFHVTNDHMEDNSLKQLQRAS